MPGSHDAYFDEFAEDYDAHLGAGLRLAGETKEHFAETRVKWTARRLAQHGVSVSSALDYGCGTGTSTPLLRDGLSLDRAVGVDVSPRSLEHAPAGPGLSFDVVSNVVPDQSHDLAFTNGVFHHIEPADRAASVAYMRDSVRPGGVVALWENNPYNPAVRYGMRANAFDRDAVLVWPRQARSLLRDAGLHVLSIDFIFIFPHALRRLRWIEPRVRRLPVGGQYLVLAQRRPVS